ncbi:MAG TPA: hypothetical protein VEC60_01210 [Reyranella sp.]|nr:hypothetical protein [Reyranella sp.]
MSDRKLRLECLKLALQHSTAGESLAPVEAETTQAAFDRAQQFYDFATGAAGGTVGHHCV